MAGALEAGALDEPLGGSMREARQKLRRFATDATPEAAADFARRFFTHLSKALTAPEGTNGTASSTAEHAVLAFVVRDAGPATNSGSTAAGRDQGQAGSAWLIEYWVAPRGVVGQLHEGSAAVQSMLRTHPASAKLEAASFQDLLDVLLQRRSPLMAITRRRLIISGDFIPAVQKLKPAFSAAMQALVAELPDGDEEVQSNPPSMASSVMWMPNDASPCCPLCRLPWLPVLRQRHHCRSCGTLVCGKCSTRRATFNRVRWCIRCAGGRYAGSNGVASFMSVSTNGVASNTSSLVEVPSPLHGGTPNALPGLPSGSEMHGVLFAHINSTSGSQLQTLISAERPSEREQRLWDRLLLAEAAAAHPVHPWRLLARKFLGSAVQFLLRASLCFGLCRAATVSTEELPVVFVTACTTALRKLPMLLPRVLLGLFFTCSAVVLATTRTMLVLGVAAIYAWNMGLGVTNGEVEGTGLRKEMLLSQASFQYPCWAAVCGGITFLVLVCSRFLGRLAEIYLTATVPISIYWFCKLLQRSFRLSDDLAQSLLYDLADSVVAPFLVERFLALGGLFVKVGQWAANVSVGVPIKLQEQLKKLTDSAPADSEAHVRAILLAEFGKPIDELFSKFELTPIASASIAQVHRAVLRSDGTQQEVAVKLQHANVEQLMLADLAALKKIIRFCCWLGGDNWEGAKSMFELWARDMVNELDFGHEANNLKEVRAGLLAAGVDVVVPTVIDGWVSRRAFLMEFCRGFRFTDMDRLVLHGVDRKALGARALQAAACQMLELGVFNSDPHSGNLLCQERGESAVPVLLDFGNCVRLTDEQRLAYCRLLVAVSEASVTKARDALKALNFESSQSAVHPERDLEYMLLVFRDTGSRDSQSQARKDFINLRNQQRDADYAALGARTKKEKKKVAKQVRRYPQHVPDEFLLFIRMMYLVRGLCTQLDAELPFLQIFECHARRALVALCPRAQRAFSWLPPIEHAASRSADDALQHRIRLAIARCCAERPGLGVQVCVRMGRQGVVVDECGGCLGMVDPRPMDHNSLIPLADLSRVFPLLAVLAEVRARRLTYNVKASGLLNRRAEADGADKRCLSDANSNPSSASAPTLRHVLAHRALDAEGAARAALMGTSASELCNVELMHGRVAAALRSESAPGAEATYTPLGPGYMAAAAVEAVSNKRLGDVLAQLPGAAGIEGELGLCAHGGPPTATLSSSLFAEFRSLLASTGGAGGSRKKNFLGAFSNASSHTATRPPEHETPAASAVPAEPAEPVKQSAPVNGSINSSVGSILDSAGGLLVDPMLALPAAKAAALSENIGLSTSGAQLCPDLACVASARALAAVLAAAEPVADSLPALGCESQGENNGGGNQLSGISSFLGLAPRSWNERGFEVFTARDSSEVAAVGLTAASGLLGVAVQWRAFGSIQTPVTVVILANDISTGAVPWTLLSEICEGLQLPSLASLPI